MLIPSERLVTWVPGVDVGVQGGIPTDRTNLINVTQAPYNADNTGATDARDAIQDAMDAAEEGDIVYLPTGTYRIDSSIILGIAFSGKTLRGDGPDLTIIDCRTNVGIDGTSFNNQYSPNPPSVITSGLTKGSTSITATNLDEWTAGTPIRIMVENDPDLPVASVYDYDIQTNQAPTSQIVKVLTKVGDTLTFEPGLYSDYGAGALECRVTGFSFFGYGVGIEDLMIDCTNYNGGPGGSFAGLTFGCFVNSWLLNVKVKDAYNYDMGMSNALFCEVRHCYSDGLKGSGTNGAAFILGASSACLIEDNIFVDGFPTIEVNGGCCGNAICFNYTNGLVDTNHAPHNQFNLYEGNAAGYQMSDGYFGSEANLTLARNYWWDVFGINLRRFTRNVSAVGNIIPVEIGCGLPFFSAGTSSGTASLINDDPWRDWEMTGELTTRTSDTEGEITLNSGALFEGGQIIRLVWGAGLDQQRFAAVSEVTGSVATVVDYSGGTVLPIVGTEIHIGPGSFYSGEAATSSYCELDLDVEATLIDKGNYYEDSETTSPTGGDTVPDSYVHDDKPAYFGILPWPAFDYLNPEEADIENIPAGYRFINGVDPPSSGGGTTITVANVTNFNIL